MSYEAGVWPIIGGKLHPSSRDQQPRIYTAKGPKKAFGTAAQEQNKGLLSILEMQIKVHVFLKKILGTFRKASSMEMCLKGISIPT